MSETIVAAIIVALPSIISSAISYKNTKILKKQDNKLEEIHQCVDKITK